MTFNHTLVKRARYFAQFAHEGQLRKYTGAPYFHHPERVAHTVYRNGGSDTMVAAAYLHDVIEDCGVAAHELRKYFGAEVANLVWALTDRFTPEVFPDMNRAWRKRMEAKRLKGESADVRAIKRADICDNTADIELFDKDFARVYTEEKAYMLSLFDEADRKELTP